MRSKSIIYFTTIILGIVLAIFWTLAPFAWMVMASLKTEGEFYSTAQILPSGFYWKNYVKLFEMVPFGRFFLNSVLISICTTLISIFLSALAAYGFSRFKFKGRLVAQNLIMIPQLFPTVLMLIPLFMIFIKFKLLNNYLSLIVPYVALVLPLAILILYNFFNSIPREIEGAAMVDGCNRFQTLVKIILPLSIPGLTAASVFIFVVSWSEYLLAATFMSSTEMFTLPVGLSMMVGRLQIQWGPMNAGAVLIVLPVAVSFVYFQKFLMRGLTAGSIK